MLLISRTVTLVVLILCICPQLVTADDRPDKTIMTSLGTRNLFSGKLTVRAAEEKGKLSFQIVRKIKDGSTTETLHPGVQAKGAVWAVFPESSDRVWVFWESSLYRWEFQETADGSQTEGKMFIGTEVVKNAPAELLKALPKDLVERLKGK